jgi:hypothetical protein
MAAPNEEHHNIAIDSFEESEQTGKIVALQLRQFPDALTQNQ